MFKFMQTTSKLYSMEFFSMIIVSFFIDRRGVQAKFFYSV